MGEYFNDIASDDRTLTTILKSSISKMIKDSELTEKTGYNVLKLADAVEEAFLQEVVQYRKDFYEKIKSECLAYRTESEQLERKVRYLNDQAKWLRNEVDGLTAEEKRLIETIKQKCEEMKYEEVDPVLAGAMKAFDWIMKNTGDKSAASKAFNSYLLGGKFNDGETYSETVMDADTFYKKFMTCRKNAL